MAERIGSPLGRDLTAAAWSVHDVVNETMAAAVRMHVSERGGTPERALLIAFGGAGPMHAYHLAHKLGIRRLLVPLRAGVLSALGLLVAPAAFDLVRTVKAPLDGFDPAAAQSVFSEMAAEIEATLRQIDRHADIAFSHAADIGYIGQGYQVTVPLDGDRPESELLWRRFAEIYEQKYGYFYDDVAAEVVDLRLGGRLADDALILQPSDPGSGRPVPKAERRAYAAGPAEMLIFQVYDRQDLAPGMSFEGPAIVEESSTTTVIDVGGHVTVDRYGSLSIEIPEEETS